MTPSCSTSVPISSNSAKEWVERISYVFTQEISIQIDHLPPVSVFDVPKALTSQKPESYTPQLIALGPYHHLRSDLYQMERYKLSAIKSISTPKQLLNFDQIVIAKLKRIDPSTRACFNRFMDYDQDSLAWILAIDGCFLLNLLHSYNENDSYKVLDTSLLHNTIITRDIMMLENQIPFIHLKEIRKALHLGSTHDENDHDSKLLWMMLEFCEAHSPVKFSIEKSGCINVRPMHLLDLMYNMVTIGPTRVPVSPFQDVPLKEFPLHLDSSSSSSASSNSSISRGEAEGEEIPEKVETFLELAQNIGNKKTQAFLKPVQVVSSIPWSTICGLFRKGTLKHGEENSKDDDSEIRIPRVSNLFRFGGIKCLPTDAGIIDIKFVEQEATLYLPVLNLNTSSEVILRNLVAYEAATSKRNLVFARYINLMNGIIDIEKDVKMLRQNGVVKGTLTDEEVMDLFNGMKKYYVRCSSNNSTYSNIDFAIEEVNKYFDKKIVVLFLRQMKRNFYASWKCLALFITVLLFVIVSLQSFCEVYECSRFWKGGNS